MTKTTIRRPLLMVAAVLIFAAVGIGLAADGGFQGREDDERDHDGDGGRGAYAIGLWGDLPYSATQVATGVPNLIADMNRHERISSSRCAIR